MNTDLPYTVKHIWKGLVLLPLLPLSAFAAMDISTGRQLFVDDYLVEATTNVVRHWNRPVKMDAPVVWPGLAGAASLVKSSDGWYSPSSRKHDGIPSIAVSAVNGRMWATRYSSPTGAEDSNNYLILATSTDDGATWREAVIYEPDFKGPVRAFDPELWIAPDNRLRWTWPFSLVLDAGRNGVSYPDGQQLADGRIVVVYDFDRMGSRQILFAVFREEDIMAGLFKTHGARPLQTIYCGNPAFKK